MSKTAIQHNGWREVKLGEIAQLSKNSWKVGDEEMPYIGLEHIDEKKLRLNSIGNSNLVTSNKYRFNAGDTLFGKLRPYFRKVVELNFDGICSTDIWVVRSKEGIDRKFIFYFFANQELVDISYSSSSGTRMPRADWAFLSETKWDIPPFPEQKAIAEVLSSLDDKIDLLHRQNKTLEDMAQALFRKWFVEEADEGWEVGRIGEVLKTELGGTPSTTKSEYWNGDIAWINSGEINKFRISEPTKYITKLGLEKSATKLLPKGTTVIAITGATLGQISLLEIDSCANQSVVGIIPNEKLPREYAFLWVKNIIDSLVANQTGGAQQHINKNDINNALITIPPQDLMQDKMPIFKDYFDKISINTFQIRTFENLRDIILPKLMSGAVRVRGF